MKGFHDFSLISLPIVSLYRKMTPVIIKEKIWRIYARIMKSSFIGTYLRTLLTRIQFSKYYNSVNALPNDYPKTVVYMADGKILCGGLTDRLRAIVSVYKLCKELNMPFKINFTSSFNLNEYLLPNSYNWYISPDEICYNRKQARLCVVWYYANRPYDAEHYTFWAKRFFKEAYKQIHIYTNILPTEKEYSDLFAELFKPSLELKELIDYHVKILGGGGVMYRRLLDFYSYWATLRRQTVLRLYCRMLKKRF